jgi:hypothetical protein
MKITRLSLWHVPLTRHSIYQMSEGKACDTVTTDAVALKISKFGGLSAALQARDCCVQLGIKICVEDT